MRTSRESGYIAIIPILLVLMILIGIGNFAYQSYKHNQFTEGLEQAKSSARTTQLAEVKEEKDTPPSYDGYKEYKNEQLGLTFKYPDEWGTVTYQTGSRNGQVAREPVLSHILLFSKNNTRIVISPNDWRYTGPSAQDFPPVFKAYTAKLLEKNKTTVFVNATDRVASIEYSIYTGELSIYGVKSLDLLNIQASVIELKRSELTFNSSCLAKRKNDQGSYQDYATLKCFDSDYRKQFSNVLASFKSL